MTDDDKTKFDISRRKLLGGLGAVGAAGAIGGGATNALLWDEELFGSLGDPNILQAGTFDLKVDWEVNYFDGRDSTPQLISTSDDYESETDDGDEIPDEVDQPGPIVDLTDVKPGDVVEHTLSLHVYGNPGFVDLQGDVFVDDDNGFSEPEDSVFGLFDDEDDGTPDGDLDDHMRAVVWYDGDDDGDGDSSDPGNNFPEEITDYTPDQLEQFLTDLTNGDVTFDTASDAFLFQGTVAELFDVMASDGFRLSPGDDVAGGFGGTDCFRPSTTHYLGVLYWLPRDIPGVDDNVVQTDSLEYEFGFHAEQCRHNATATETPQSRCTPCSFDTSGASTAPEVTVQSTDASSFPQVSTFLGIGTPSGGDGSLTSSDFAACEDDCVQSVSSAFTASGKKVDMAFLFDVSGSMGGQIESVKDNIDSLVTDLENEGIDAQYALEVYSDDGGEGGATDPDGVARASDLTDATDFQDNVLPPLTTSYLGVGGGGDGPEDAWDSIVEVHGTFSSADSEGPLSWRTGSERVLILITDNVAETETGDGGFDATRASALSALQDGNYLYFPVTDLEGVDADPASLIDEPDVRGQKIELGSDFGPIFTTITDEISGSTYRLDYTTTNPTTDGATRNIVIRIDDPDEGTLEAVTSYTAPSP